MRMPSLALALALFSTACFLAVDTAPAEREVDHFHRLLDQGQFEKFYAETGDEFKAVSKQADFVPILEAVHRKLGEVKSAEKTRTDRNVSNTGTFVGLTYQTTFAEGPATERFDFHIVDGKPVLVGYHVNSNLLITK
jgi:hypothetical protein